MRDPLADPRPLIVRLYAYVAYVVGDGPEAEDLTSTALERALRYRDSYDPRRGTPLAWLIGIARRCIADRDASASAAAGEPQEVAAPDDLEVEAVDRLTIRAGMAALPERDRELLALRFGSDLTARQIGELLDLRTNAVEVALHRALARLRSELAAAHPAAGDEARKDLGLAGGM